MTMTSTQEHTVTLTTRQGGSIDEIYITLDPSRPICDALSPLVEASETRQLIKRFGGDPNFSAWSLIIGYENFPKDLTDAYDDCHALGRAVAAFMPAGVTTDHESGAAYWYAPTQALRDAAARALVCWMLQTEGVTP